MSFTTRCRDGEVTTSKSQICLPSLEVANGEVSRTCKKLPTLHPNFFCTSLDSILAACPLVPACISTPFYASEIAKDFETPLRAII